MGIYCLPFNSDAIFTQDIIPIEMLAIYRIPASQIMKTGYSEGVL